MSHFDIDRSASESAESSKQNQAEQKVLQQIDAYAKNNPTDKKAQEMPASAEATIAALSKHGVDLAKLANMKNEKGQNILLQYFIKEDIKYVANFDKLFTNPSHPQYDSCLSNIKSQLEKIYDSNKAINDVKNDLTNEKDSNQKKIEEIKKKDEEIARLKKQGASLCAEHAISSPDTMLADKTQKDAFIKEQFGETATEESIQEKIKTHPDWSKTGLGANDVLSFIYTKTSLEKKGVDPKDPKFNEFSHSFAQIQTDLNLFPKISNIVKKEPNKEGQMATAPIPVNDFNNLSDQSVQSIAETGKGAGFEAIETSIKGESVAELTDKSKPLELDRTDTVEVGAHDVLTRLTQPSSTIELGIIGKGTTLTTENIQRLAMMSDEIQQSWTDFLPQIRASMPDAPPDFAELSFADKQNVMQGLLSFVQQNAKNESYKPIVDRLTSLLTTYSTRQQNYLDALQGHNPAEVPTEADTARGTLELAKVATNRARMEAMKGFFGTVAAGLSETIGGNSLGLDIQLKPDTMQLDAEGNYSCHVDFDGKDYTIAIDKNGNIQMTDYAEVDMLNGAIHGASKDKPNVKELGVDLVGFEAFRTTAERNATDPNVLGTCLTQSVAAGTGLSGFDDAFGKKIQTDFEKSVVRDFRQHRDQVSIGLAHEFQNQKTKQLANDVFKTIIPGFDLTSGASISQADNPQKFDIAKTVMTTINRQSIAENEIFGQTLGIIKDITTKQPSDVLARDPVYKNLIAPIKDATDPLVKEKAFHTLIEAFNGHDVDNATRTFISADLLNTYASKVLASGTTIGISAFREDLRNHPAKEKIGNKEAWGEIDQVYKRADKDRIDEGASWDIAMAKTKTDSIDGGKWTDVEKAFHEEVRKFDKRLDGVEGRTEDMQTKTGELVKNEHRVTTTMATIRESRQNGANFVRLSRPDEQGQVKPYFQIDFSSIRNQYGKDVSRETIKGYLEAGFLDNQDTQPQTPTPQPLAPQTLEQPDKQPV